MAESGAGSPVRREGWRRALRWWGTAGAFLAGLFVGAVLVGLLGGSTVVVPAPLPAEPDAALPEAPVAEGGATAEVSIDEDCLRAVNAAQDVAELVDELGAAIADFNAVRMDEVVRRLQPLQRRLQTSVDTCEVRAGRAGGSTPAPTGSAAPSDPGAPATPSPTD
ncbi:hypothetical protein [Blastococcus sp. SYSU DS1024]